MQGLSTLAVGFHFSLIGSLRDRNRILVNQCVCSTMVGTSTTLPPSYSPSPWLLETVSHPVAQAGPLTVCGPGYLETSYLLAPACPVLWFQEYTKTSCKLCLVLKKKQRKIHSLEARKGQHSIGWCERELTVLLGPASVFSTIDEAHSEEVLLIGGEKDG